MTKTELIQKLEEILEEIPINSLAKDISLQWIYDEKINYNRPFLVPMAWQIPTKCKSWGDIVDGLEKLPIFEKYFIYIYSLYEGYLESIGDNDTDKRDITLLKYRIWRNIFVHNLGVVKQRNVDEFDKKAKEYNPSLTQDDLNKLFNCQDGAPIWIETEDLIKFIDLIKNNI